MRQLLEINNRLTNGPNHFVEAWPQRVWKEYKHVLSQEEIMWFEKARRKWLKYGDLNTKYFHGTTTIRRNKIDVIQHEHGGIISQPMML